MEQEYEYNGKSLTLIYENEWSTYEEWGAVRIFEDQDGEFYIQEGGYSVMSFDNPPDWMPIEPILDSRVLEVIDDWEELTNSEWI